MTERKLYPKPPRRKKDRSYRRYRVFYKEMLIDGGGAVSWVGYYRWLWLARTAAWWNQNIATWGGEVTLTDQHKEF